MITITKPTIHYDEQQASAILSPASLVVVKAGPGSGKTRTLIGTVDHLITKGVHPSKIMMITFTKRAAIEMQERSSCSVGNISTIHSMCCKFLRKLGADFSIWDEQDAKRAMHKICTDIDNEITKKQSANIYKEFCYNMSTLQKPPNKIKEYAINYKKYMYDCNALDFCHLQYAFYMKILRDKKYRKEIQSRFPYILVDEYQDINAIQHNIIKLLQSKYLFIVGDIDQSIYAFRGGSPRHFKEWQRNPQADCITLHNNYRTHESIVMRAKCLMGKLTQSEIRHIIPSTRCNTVHSSYNNVLREVLDCVKRNIYFGEGDICILCRNNSDVMQVQCLLANHKIKCKVSKYIDVFNRAVVKDIFSYLKLSHNKNDNMALARIINTPARGIGKKRLNDILSQDKPYEYAINKYKKLKEFDEEINNIISIDTLVGKIEYIASDIIKVSERNIIECLVPIAEGYDNINDFMDTIHLMEADTEDTEDEAIKIMTIHSAKGLEFDAVILYNVSSGILPDTRLRANQTMKEKVVEERRLLYVGMTRAKKTLDILTKAYHRSQFINDLEGKYAYRRFRRGEYITWQ